MNFFRVVRVYVIDHDEDDPSKCTGKKMVRMGLAFLTDRPKGIILDPYAEIPVSIDDRGIADKLGITVVDASWNRLDKGKFPRSKLSRRLPLLLAGNPTNYGIGYRLSSVEAVFAALYIMDLVDEAMKYVGTYKWMTTFYTLNEELLEDYRGKKAEEIMRIEKEVLARYMEGPQV